MDIFVRLIYQPFFNVLVFFYILIEKIPGVQPDMGLAVIFFTIVIRILLLPLSISSTRSAKERHDIEVEIASIKKQYSGVPAVAREKVKKLFRSNRRILIAESVNFIIQVMIFFILYRIFTTGLEGADIPLLYPFLPPVQLPFNLMFLGRFDLSHTSFPLNIFQSFTIMAAESISLLNSPFPISRNDVVRYVVILPIASFIVFMFLPAGKKIFVITTLWFSFFFTLTNLLTHWFTKWFNRVEVVQAQEIEKRLITEPPTHTENAQTVE